MNEQENLEARLRSTLAERAAAIPEPPVASQSITTPAPRVTAGSANDFASFYQQQRGSIYAALVLTLRDRDNATEAVDAAFSKSLRRWRKVRRMERPSIAVFASGLAIGTRRAGKGAGEIPGFRLNRAVDDTDTARTLDAFGDLTPSSRAILTLDSFLAWPHRDIAEAVGIEPSEVQGRIDQAHGKLATELDVERDSAAALVAAALGAEAAALHEPLSRVETVRGRAWLMKAGVTLGAAAAVIVLVGGAGLGIRALVRDGGTDSPVAQKGGPDPTGGLAPSIAAAGNEFEWTRVPLSIGGEGEPGPVAFGPSGFVFVGQTYDGRGPNSFAFASEDGFDWTGIPAPFQGVDGWIAGLSGSASGYLATGNLFDQQLGREHPTAWFSPDASGWTSLDLPVAEDTEINGVRVELYTNVQSVATVGDGYVILGMEHADIGDPENLFRDKLPEGITTNFGWGFSGTGVEIYGRNGETIFRATMEELGVDPELAALMGSGRTVLWRSEDGETWERTTVSGTFGQDVWVSGIAATSKGLILTAQGRAGGAAYFSTDAIDWTRVVVEKGAIVTGVAAINDTLIVLGADLSGQGAGWNSKDGATWTRIDDPDLAGGTIDRAISSSTGVIAISQNIGLANQIGPAEVDTGDVLVKIYPTGLHEVFDGEGMLLAELYSEDVIYESDGSVVLEDAEGELYATLTASEVEAAWQVEYRKFETGGAMERPFEEPELDIVLSSDGAEWVRLSTADAFGSGFYPFGMAVGNDTVVITGFDDAGRGGLDGPPPISVWVGTVGEQD